MNSVLRVITLSGAFLAFLIGSGVATGQELMQYYSPYGFDVFGTAITIAVILMIANYGYAWAGKHGKIEKGSDVFAFYCGPLAGKIFDLFTVLFCYMSFVVMVGGGAATLEQQYGMHLMVGAVLIMLMASCTVILGLNSVVNIIGKIAPALIGLIVIICLISLVQNADGIAKNIAAINDGSLKVTKAGTNWFTSGASNGGFCILWLAGFTAALGIKEDFRTLMRANIASSIALVIVNMIIGFAILAQMDVLSTTQIPNLIIAEGIWEPLAYIFGVLIFIAIYTTACPLLWTTSSRFAPEGSAKFKIITLLLALVGMGIALYLPFNILMNYIYTINGYLGFVVLLIMCVRMFIMIRSSKMK